MSFLIALLGVAILYFLQCHLYKSQWLKHLSIQISFEASHATEGDDLTLTETIRNQKLLPLPMMHLKFMASKFLSFYDKENSNVSDNFYRDDILSVLMYQQITRTLQFQCTKRGYYTIDQVDVVSSDIFLSCSMAYQLKVHEYLYVYPRLLEDRRIEIPFKKMLGTVLTKRYYNEDPFEFAGIREYQTYDSMKNVNWKASAKTGTLKVNVHDYTASQQIHIILNLESQTLLKYEDLLEFSIQLAATFANAFIHAGIPTSLTSNGLDIVSKEATKVATGSGNNHMTKINEALARIDTVATPQPFLSFFEEATANLGKEDYILLISTYQKEELQEKLRHMKFEHKDFLWIVPLNQEIENQIGSDLLDCITIITTSH